MYPSKYLDVVLHFPPYRSILLELGLGQGQRPEKGEFYWTFCPPFLKKKIYPPVYITVVWSPKPDLPGSQVKPHLEPVPPYRAAIFKPTRRAGRNFPAFAKLVSETGTKVAPLIAWERRMSFRLILIEMFQLYFPFQIK